MNPGFQSPWVARPAPRKLYVTEKPSGSSLSPPNPDTDVPLPGRPSYGSLAKVIDVPLLTLSDFIDQHKRPLPNLVKLDVQGAELAIFKGTRPEHLVRYLAASRPRSNLPSSIRASRCSAMSMPISRAQGFILFDILPARVTTALRARSRTASCGGISISIKNRRDISCRLIAGDAFYLRAPGTGRGERQRHRPS